MLFQCEVYRNSISNLAEYLIDLLNLAYYVIQDPLSPIFLLFSFLPLFVEMRCKSIQAPEQQHTYIFKRYYNSCEDVAVSLSRTVLTSATGKIILGIGVDVTSVLISFVCFGRAIPFTTGQAATLEVSRSKVALQLVWCDNTAYQLRGVGPFLARTPTSKTIVTKDQP